MNFGFVIFLAIRDGCVEPRQHLVDGRVDVGVVFPWLQACAIRVILLNYAVHHSVDRLFGSSLNPIVVVPLPLARLSRVNRFRILMGRFHAK